MNMIKSIFWNTEQSRLRAGWRIFLQLLLYRIIWKGLGAFIGSIPGMPTEISSQAPLWYFLVPAGIRLARAPECVVGGSFL